MSAVDNYNEKLTYRNKAEEAANEAVRSVVTAAATFESYEGDWKTLAYKGRPAMSPKRHMATRPEIISKWSTFETVIEKISDYHKAVSQLDQAYGGLSDAEKLMVTPPPT